MHCVSGAVNTQGFVWKFVCAIYTFSFIHSFVLFALHLCRVLKFFMSPFRKVGGGDGKLLGSAICSSCIVMGPGQCTDNKAAC